LCGGIILGHRGSDALKLGAGVDGSALALRMDIQNLYAQEPLSVRLGFLWPGRSHDAAFGLDVFFGAILDEVGEGLTGVQPGKQRGACDWSGGDIMLNVCCSKECCQRQQKTNDASFRVCGF
jgi:hypothetical protein